ncbi:aminopeptidase [Sodalis ligni]|jgi:alkaline phosphatase isozyme conversion protein|uniref:Alkaline phosphatase isozyme conversion protein n=1 Tax=Sodalis ligni TaxID=2697027 RepID=A0A4R1NKX9_9GAMM|nr:aminopeptidase [Sodalis ligni]TCL06601.1 alkaline phosphatase isozyme conversion protein [Sodalis ligni]
MFHLGRITRTRFVGHSKRARLVLGLSGLLTVCLPAFAAPDHYAQEQMRYIATYFPGRMAGSPAELMAAEYLQRRLAQMGYQSNLRTFNTRYQFHGSDGKADWRKISATSVIAAKAGATGGEILVIAHSDTFMPRSDGDLNNNLGGLTLQGVDDNASGVGVMLDLARRLGPVPLAVGVRFVALSAGEPETLGAEDYLQRMTPQEKRNTLLVINLDSLIGGEKLRVDYSPDSGDSRLLGLVKDLGTRARQAGIPLILNTGIRAAAECSTDALPFAKAGFAVLDVGSGIAGNRCRERNVSRNFPHGMVRYQSPLDNLTYLDRHLTGQMDKRARDSLALLGPMLERLTGADKPKG